MSAVSGKFTSASAASDLAKVEGCRKNTAKGKVTTEQRPSLLLSTCDLEEHEHKHPVTATTSGTASPATIFNFEQEGLSQTASCSEPDLDIAEDVKLCFSPVLQSALVESPRECSLIKWGLSRSNSSASGTPGKFSHAAKHLNTDELNGADCGMPARPVPSTTRRVTFGSTEFCIINQVSPEVSDTTSHSLAL